MKIMVFALMLVLSACNFMDIDFDIPHHDMPPRMVIFHETSEAAQNASFIIGNSEPIDGTWTPSIDDVMDLERALPDRLRENSIAAPIADEVVNSYWRQFSGIVQDGKPYIVASYSCMEFERWQEQWIFVMDGGECFFELTYDPETGTFPWLYVHGFA